VVHVTDTEPSVHMYRSDTALQLPPEDGRTRGLLHIITDGTQNTLWMCTAIERNKEQKRHCGVFALPLLPWKSNKYLIFSVRESPQLPSTQSALWPVWIYIFSTLSLKPHDFGKKVIKRKTCFHFLYNNLCETIFNPIRIQGKIKSVNSSSCKVPAIIV
jgi:hypothetical protein